MPIAFHAPVVLASEEEWGTLVILSVDDTLEAERYLMIQRKPTFSADDARFQMDDVYIETCGQGWSWYGHIESVDLYQNRLRVRLDPDAAARMSNDGVIDVSFDLAPNRFDDLRASLRRAFDGHAYYAESTA